MAEMGAGYGSECHLLRYLGRHRNRFDYLIREKIGAEAVRWLDFHFDPTKVWLDGERKGLTSCLPITLHGWHGGGSGPKDGIRRTGMPSASRRLVVERNGSSWRRKRTLAN